MSVDSGVSRRKASAEVLLRREAIDFLKPIVSDLPSWQQQAARLVGLGERLGGKGEFDQQRLKEALDLSNEIQLRRSELDKGMQLWPAGVSGNGRVRDALRALESVSAAASRACFLLSVGKP